jgi:superfamily II DNA or RNA helicase
MLEKLFDWQRECLDRWTANGGRGIVNVVTGAGKTMLAVAAIASLNNDSGLRVKIVVPKGFLAVQWARVLRDELGAARADIGYRSGTRKDAPRRFMIYVINSARYSLARSIKTELDAGCAVMLIADECHHYGTAENSKIFDFIKFIDGSARYYSLGLSATPYTPQYKAVLVPALGGEIYRYGFAQAIAAEIINRFAVFQIALHFNKAERYEYD